LAPWAAQQHIGLLISVIISLNILKSSCTMHVYLCTGLGSLCSMTAHSLDHIDQDLLHRYGSLHGTTMSLAVKSAQSCKTFYGRNLQMLIS
jgi:hypothetical protein